MAHQLLFAVHVRVVAMTSVADADAAPEQEGPSLKGLAEEWQSDEIIRDMMLHRKEMLTWPTQKTVGVINFDSMRLNSMVIFKLLSIWVPQVSYPKTVCIDQVREEVRGNETNQIKGFFGNTIFDESQVVCSWCLLGISYAQYPCSISQLICPIGHEATSEVGDAWWCSESLMWFCLPTGFRHLRCQKAWWITSAGL